jgi:hydrogenase expression/formation protein HypC
MQVKEICNSLVARAETMGITQLIRIDLVPQVSAGDSVVVHAGFAIEIIDPELAKHRLEFLARLLGDMGEDQEDAG